MELQHASTPKRTVHTVALAYFTRRQNVSDATRDLCNAGFAGTHISISQPTGSDDGVIERQPLVNAIGVHSLRWQIERARTHDRQRRGANQMSGADPFPAEPENPTCWTIDLATTLRALSIHSDMISLLERDTIRKGMFVLVDAPDRVPEANDILSNNAGFLRTDYLRGLPA